MSEQVEKLLEEEMVRKVKELENTENHEKRKELIEEISAMHDMCVKKAAVEKDTSSDEMQKQRFQLITQIIASGVQIGLAILSTASYNRWFNRSLRFQETGTHYLPETKNLLSRMLPRK